MRKPDVEVKEVICSETGKPMPKIPLWMAEVKVKFVSDEARQKSAPAAGLMDLEPLRRSAGAASELDELKELDVAGEMLEGADEEAGYDLDGDDEPDTEDELP